MLLHSGVHAALSQRHRAAAARRRLPHAHRRLLLRRLRLLSSRCRPARGARVQEPLVPESLVGRHGRGRRDGRRQRAAQRTKCPGREPGARHGRWRRVGRLCLAAVEVRCIVRWRGIRRRLERQLGQQLRRRLGRCRRERRGRCGRCGWLQKRRRRGWRRRGRRRRRRFVGGHTLRRRIERTLRRWPRPSHSPFHSPLPQPFARPTPTPLARCHHLSAHRAERVPCRGASPRQASRDRGRVGASLCRRVGLCAGGPSYPLQSARICAHRIPRSPLSPLISPHLPSSPPFSM